MPQRCGSNAASSASRGDPFHALPDSVVQHVLGFLPAGDTVRTCVVARRWHALWRSVARLRIVDVEVEDVWSLNRFVNRVLLLREPGCSLEECEFDIRGFSDLYRVCADQWMRHALICNVRVLQLRLYADHHVHLGDWPLLSRHLMRLEPQGLDLSGSFLDFSSCLVLEDLKITDCLIETDNILSHSLKHLNITGCELWWRLIPTHISAPNLTSLWLDDYFSVTPIIESMPLLETASVMLGHHHERYCNFCDKGEPGDCTCDMSIIYYASGRRNNVTVLLGGLSNVKYLELKVAPETVRLHFI
ncbi:hypothetical protein QOZ80_9BG0700390 [Eleusine coracana subsp. coracana]|nr:hypothetical protein QOZ80_9BG0700390 [Eleusine coracana subsp. coracana]